METHKLRCLTTELAMGPKVITRGPTVHLLPREPCNLCFHKKPAKTTKSSMPPDVCMITCYQGGKNTHQQKTNGVGLRHLWRVDRAGVNSESAAAEVALLQLDCGSSARRCRGQASLWPQSPGTI